MSAGPIAERNQDATLYVGGLDGQMTESLLWELFLQAGPIVNVYMPKDRVTQLHQGYGFVEFLSEKDADYAIKIMNMIKLYGKPIRVNKASTYNKNLDVGANIFIGNLSLEVDEKLLYDTFSAFGVILQSPKITRDPVTGNSKGFAFINFASFDASDTAMDVMNGQYLCNRPISVSYAFKKDSKSERHGSAAERLLAAKNPLTQADRPHHLFADAPIKNVSSNIMPQAPSTQNTNQMNQGPALPPPPPVLPPALFNATVPPPPPPPVPATQSPELPYNLGIPPPPLTQPSPLIQQPLMQPSMMQPPMMQPSMMQPPMMQPPMIQPLMHERLLNNQWGPLENSLSIPPPPLSDWRSPLLPFLQGPISRPYPPNGY